MIVPLGYQVLRQACHDAKQWQHDFPSDPPLTMTVNLSVRQLDHPDCIAEVHKALDESGLPPDSLVLEITESFMISDPEAAIARLCELKGLGVRLALDDFGTGFSSLHYLERFPLDLLKIPKDFVDGLSQESTPDNAGLAGAIVAIARTLGLATVAEGVETAPWACACRLGEPRLRLRAGLPARPPDARLGRPALPRAGRGVEPEAASTRVGA